HDGGTEVKKIKLPTHKEDGYSGDTCCIGCNVVLKTGEVVPKIPHTHDGEWKHDEKLHWLTCTGCNENYDIAPHTFATEASILASCKNETELAFAKLNIADFKEEYDQNNDTKFQNPIYYFCTVCYRVKKEEYKFYEKIHDMTTGDNLVYALGTIEGATFTSVADIKDFLAVSIDNKQLKLEDIKVKAGSTIVTISSEYMDTLSNGKHTVSIYSTTGTATATFTVKGEESLNPSTGDNGNMPLWISLLFVSGGALLLFGISKKRRKVNEK
ncbi:MAG: LPXTG cell wall anchor domain-containing protein, partial [Anaerovoracaceae bacterium]